MSEDPVEYKARGELKFVRLRSLPDDLIGYVTYKEGYIVVEMPLRIEVETLFDEGRQILAMQEYLPQAVVEIKHVEFNLEDVLFATPIRADFVSQYEQVSDFFYNNQATIKPPKLPKDSVEKTAETAQKVVSILEAMASKKDKPIH
jgi:hypothetical protein